MFHVTSLSDEANDDDRVGFITVLNINKDGTDVGMLVAKAFYAKFGLRDEKIIRQFTLFVNQYRSESGKSANEIEAEAANFNRPTAFY